MTCQNTSCVPSQARRALVLLDADLVVPLLLWPRKPRSEAALVPPLDVDQLDQIVGFEAQQQVPFPLTEAVWDYQTLGNEGDPEIEVMLVAIKSDELEAVNHVIRSSGFQTGKVDLAPLAIYNAFRYNYPDVDQPVLLIDMGARSTNLIYSEGKKFFVRTINTGTREITQSISKEFGISFLEAEVKKQAQVIAIEGTR